jgi:KaiC/GvpD/RAD55 family RecA-like ATPase
MGSKAILTKDNGNKEPLAGDLMARGSMIAEGATNVRYLDTPSEVNMQAALTLADQGIPVFPFRVVPRTGKSPTKKPCITGFKDRATTDPEQIARWWRKWPDAMPGLPTGTRTGFAVLDIDRKGDKDGFETLRLMGVDPDDLTTIQVESPSGGRHLYFRCPEGVGGGSADQFGLGLDLRAEGNYVAAPGAVSEAGAYKLLSGALTDAPPAWPRFLSLEQQNRDPGNAQPTGLPFRVVLDALSHLANDGDDFASRDDWVKIGAALHAETGGDQEGFAAFDDWSAQWPGYDSEATEAAWKSFTADKPGGATGWTIIREAEKRGWRNPERQEMIDAMLDEAADWEAQLSDEARALIWGPPSKPPSRLAFLSPKDCAEQPSRSYVIKGLLAERDVGAIVGAPGAGKSLLGPYLGYAVARGAEAFGRRTRQGRVFYVAAEDFGGMLARVKALRAELGEADDFRVVGGVSDLLSKDSADRKALIEAVKAERPSLIVIDTLSIAFPGLEENEAKGMGAVVAVARALAKWGAAVLLIHHDTKQGDGLPRGHSILNGALDVSLHLKRNDRVVRGSPTKNRNGTTDQELAFEIVEIPIGEDEDGDPITTARCAELDARNLPKTGTPLSKSVKAALDILEDLLRGRQSIQKSEWRAACFASDAVSGAEKPDTRRAAYRRALEELTRRKIIASQGERIRFTESPEMLLGDEDA